VLLHRHSAILLQTAVFRTLGISFEPVLIHLKKLYLLFCGLQRDCSVQSSGVSKDFWKHLIIGSNT